MVDKSPNLEATKWILFIGLSFERPYLMEGLTPMIAKSTDFGGETMQILAKTTDFIVFEKPQILKLQNSETTDFKKKLQILKTTDSKKLQILKITDFEKPHSKSTKTADC